MAYSASEKRYEAMRYNRCGRSGVKLPTISLGLWHNFGSVDVFDNSRAILLHAFDKGITHFDLANNYGPDPRFCRRDLRARHAERPATLPRRDDHQHKSRLHHVGWPLRRLGFTQVSGRQPGSEPQTHGAGLCRYLLPSPPRPRDSARRNHACARSHRTKRASLVCGDFQLQTGRSGEGDQDLTRTGHALPDPPTLLLHVQPLGRRRTARSTGQRGGGRHCLFAAGAGIAD